MGCSKLLYSRGSQSHRDKHGGGGAVRRESCVAPADEEELPLGQQSKLDDPAQCMDKMGGGGDSAGGGLGVVRVD